MTEPHGAVTDAVIRMANARGAVIDKAVREYQQQEGGRMPANMYTADHVPEPIADAPSWRQWQKIESHFVGPDAARVSKSPSMVYWFRLE